MEQRKSHPTEIIYDSAGKLRHSILSQIGVNLRSVRRIITEIEFEEMNEAPDYNRILGLAIEADTIIKVVKELAQEGG